MKLRTVAGRVIAAAVLALVAGVAGHPPGDPELTAPDVAPASATGRVVGADISWPECPSSMGIPGKRGQNKPMPPPTSRFVVLGLTNGPAFFPNPCLKRQVTWVKNRHLYAAAYAVTTYPFPRHLRRYGSTGPYGTQHLLGRLRNVGYNQAKFNLATMKAAGLSSPVVWIDVEHSSLMAWPRTPMRNRAVIQGLLRGYGEERIKVGFYSTPYLWHQILGDVRYGKAEWRTAGQTSMSAALSRCSGRAFQGGRAVLAQWWIPSKDFDVMCPGYGTPAAMSRWFHKY